MQTFTIFIQGICGPQDGMCIIRQLAEAMDAGITHVWVYHTRRGTPQLCPISDVLEAIAKANEPWDLIDVTHT